MTTDPITPEYSHTQTAPLCLILYASALLCCAIGLGIGETLGMHIAVVVGGILTLFGTATHHLKVEDRSDRLTVRFGPMPLMRTAVNYARIESAEVGRTLLLDGWGVHYSVRGGWVWNLWGRAYVVIDYKNGGTLRIGTDDAGNLIGVRGKRPWHGRKRSWHSARVRRS